MLTSGFGLLSDEGDGGAGNDGGNGGAQSEKPDKVEVSVLNATQDDSGAVPIAGVPGLAGDIAKQVVKPAGFAIGEKTDAPSGLSTSVIMFDPDQEGAEDAAAELAAAIADQLGETKVQPIVPEVAELCGRRAPRPRGRPGRRRGASVLQRQRLTAAPSWTTRSSPTGSPSSSRSPERSASSLLLPLFLSQRRDIRRLRAFMERDARLPGARASRRARRCSTAPRPSSSG